MNSQHTTYDPEKYPLLSEQDELMIKREIKKAETKTDSIHSFTSSTDEQNNTSIDTSPLVPTRIFYVLRHNLFSKEIFIIDITSNLNIPYAGGEISDSFRNAARALSEDKSLAANPVFLLTRNHWYSSKFTMKDKHGTEIATWKHGGSSWSKAHLSFPQHSPHAGQDFIMAATRWGKRTNEWVRDGATYSWRCDSKVKANRMTLTKKTEEGQVVVGRYAQRWGSWITGGLLLVDGNREDEGVACLTACVMLKRMQQRAAERSKYSGGGGG